MRRCYGQPAKKGHKAPRAAKQATKWIVSEWVMRPQRTLQ